MDVDPEQAEGDEPDAFQLRYDSNMEAAQSRNNLMRRRISAIEKAEAWQFTPASKMRVEPVDAIRKMLKYLHLDPDGGILNLGGGDTGKDAQPSKVPAIQRRRGGLYFRAPITLLRLIGNPILIGLHHYPVLAQAILGYEYVTWLPTPMEARCAKHVPDWSILGVPLDRIIIFVAVCETLILLSRLGGIIACIRASVCSKEAWEHRKFLVWSQLCWNHFLKLQNVSALRALQYVNPSLWSKNIRSCQRGSEMAARMLLAKLFRKDHGEVTNGMLCDAGNHLIIRARSGQGCKKTEAMRSLFDTPYQVATTLIRERAAVESHARALGVPLPWFDVEALDLGWRMHVIRCFECVYFGIRVLIAFVIGMAGFVSKICICALLLGLPVQGSQTVCHPRFGFIYVWLYVLLFVNQAIGIVNIQHTLLKRVHVWVFGGHDARLEPEEKSLVEVYQRTLMQHIWESGLGTWMKMAICLTLDDDDLQRLVVEEDHHVKALVTMGIRQYLIDHASYSTQARDWAVWLMSIGLRAKDPDGEALCEPMVKVDTAGPRGNRRSLQTAMSHNRTLTLRIQSIAETEEWEFQTVGERGLAPDEAMNQLLTHLHLDPDGGILNLHDDGKNVEEDDGEEQPSKVPSIQRSGPALYVRAPLALCSLIGNPLMTMLHNIPILVSGVFGAAVGISFDLELADQGATWSVGGLPLPRLLVWLAVIETAMLLYVYGSVLLRIRKACSGKLGDWKERKYALASELCWTELFKLQNISAIRGLYFVHPNLLGKRMKASLNVSNMAGCVLLERLFCLESEEVPNGQLCDAGNHLIMKSCDDEETKELAMISTVYDEPYMVAQRLAVTQRQVRKYAAKSGGNSWFNAEALELGCRLRLIHIAEIVLFLLGCLVGLGVGMLGFIGKIGVSALLLFPEQFGLVVSPWYTWAYIICFMNQVMGAVNVQHLLLQRAQLFVFGGHDSVLTSEEGVVVEVYLASLMKHVWQSSMDTASKIAFCLTFDDDDLQRLVVEEDHEVKDSVIIGTRRYVEGTAGRVLYDGSWVDCFMQTKTVSHYSRLGEVDPQDQTSARQRDSREAMIGAAESMQSHR